MFNPPGIRETWASRALLGHIVETLRVSPAATTHEIFNIVAHHAGENAPAPGEKPFDTAVWLARPERLEDMNPSVMSVFHAYAKSDALPLLPLEPDYVERVMDLIRYDPARNTVRGRRVRTVNVDQMALMYHLARLGAQPAAAMELFTHRLPEAARLHAWGVMRSYYNSSPYGNWSWKNAADGKAFDPRPLFGREITDFMRATGHMPQNAL